MSTITIVKKAAGENEIITVPRREYEQLLVLRRLIKFVTPTKEEKRNAMRGEREMRRRQYRDWRTIKHELAPRSHA